MEQLTKKNAPSNELVQHATELLEVAKVEPVEVLPAVSGDETESIDFSFFQRYYRRKKLTEQTGRFTRSLKTRVVLKDIQSSFDEELGICTMAEEVREPVIEDGKKVTALKAEVRTVEIGSFPFGNIWKVRAFFKKDEADKLNMLIGRAVRQFKDRIAMNDGKEINKSQPVYVAVAIAEGLVLSNYQLYGHENKATGLRGLNLTSKGKEADFATTTLNQMQTVIERMQGKGMDIHADWQKLLIQFPSLTDLKRKKK